MTPLSIRRVAIDTFREHVAYLHRDCTAVRAEGFQALSKVEVSGNGATILAVLNVVDDECIVGPTELGLSEEAFASLGLPAGHAASLQHAEPPASIAALHRKIAGERLSHDDLHGIIRDIAGMRYTKIELAAFVVAANQFEMDRDEVLHLTDAMIAAGRRLDWRQEVRGGPVVDKHCIGGIPATAPSMLVVPIVAAHGMLIPRPRRARSPRRRARPTPWSCWRTSTCPSSGSRRSCARPAAAWPGAARPISRRPTTC